MRSLTCMYTANIQLYIHCLLGLNREVREYSVSWILLVATHSQPAATAAKSLQSCLTLCDHTDGSPPGSPVPGILQARRLERVAIPFSRGSSRPRDQTRASCIAGGFFTRRAGGQGSNPCLLHCRGILYCLSQQGSLV